MMAVSHKRSGRSGDRDQQEIRDQEVLRANRELQAYFKGRRTEREARAALKVIKAFIRDREDMAPASRRPLPGRRPAKPASGGRRRKVSTVLSVLRQHAEQPAASPSEADEADAAGETSTKRDE
jgi:hypothetical protein